MGWGAAKRTPVINHPIDIAIKLGWNQWNGRTYPQAELIDWRMSENLN